MNKEDFYFDLPQELIAQTPLETRSQSKLMVVNREDGSIYHKKFMDIMNYLNPGDCLVLNDSRVIPARLYGVREPNGGKVEILLLKRLSTNQWNVLVKPGKKAKPGDVLNFGDGLLKGEIINIAEEGSRIIEFSYSGIFEEILDKLGSMPLPPYITEELKDKERYQTVYSKYDGSAAAPTAGLHFTNDLLNKIKAKGVNIAFITLHVGLGTFRPVKAENIFDHKMHSEFYMVSKDTANIINTTKQNGGKIISVGTTSTRTLESIADANGMIKEVQGWTDIFIYPGYKFKVVDGLITNFHLPESTLIMLVSAFSNREYILNAYNEAIANKYRFFSFGDAMLII